MTVDHTADDPPDDPSDEPMDVASVLDKLNAALTLQYRSALQFTLVAAGTQGVDVFALSPRLWRFAKAELADARRLIEKIVALGGRPTVAVAPLEDEPDGEAALDRLIANEQEAIAALHAGIEDTGQEPRSEALEHLLEHVIMRKQEQVDALVRARHPS